VAPKIHPCILAPSAPPWGLQSTRTNTYGCSFRSDQIHIRAESMQARLRRQDATHEINSKYALKRSVAPEGELR